MSIQSNIWKLNTDRFFASFWLFAPILVSYYEANGLNASEVYLIQAVFASALALFEIPTGYFSDVVGRKAALIVGALMIPTGICIYAMTSTFWGFVLAELFLAIGLSLRSGTDSALLYDSLLEMKREKEHKKLEGTAFFASQIGISVANALGGLIAILSLKLTFWINAMTSLVLLPLSLAITEPKKESRHSQSLKAHAADIGKAVLYCAKHPEIRAATLYLAFMQGILMASYWSSYLYYSRAGISIGYFGIIAAIGGLMSGLGSKIAHRVDNKWGAHIALLVPLITAPSFVVTGLIDGVWGLPFIFLSCFLWGYAGPLLRDTVHKHTPTKIRATVLSVANMGGRLCYAALALPIGYLVDATSVATGYFAFGGLYVGLCLWPALSLARRQR